MGSGGAQLFEPGSREWYADKMFGTGTPVDVSQRNADAVDFLSDISPGYGEARSLRDAWDSSGRGGEALASGEFGDAASEYGNMLMALAGAAPGAGMMAKTAGRAGKAARESFTSFFDDAVFDAKKPGKAMNDELPWQVKDEVGDVGQHVDFFLYDNATRGEGVASPDQIYNHYLRWSDQMGAKPLPKDQLLLELKKQGVQPSKGGSYPLKLSSDLWSGA